MSLINKNQIIDHKGKIYNNNYSATMFDGNNHAFVIYFGKEHETCNKLDRFPYTSLDQSIISVVVLFAM